MLSRVLNFVCKSEEIHIVCVCVCVCCVCIDKTRSTATQHTLVKGHPEDVFRMSLKELCFMGYLVLN